MRHLLYWLCAGLVVTALHATVVGAVQTVLRDGANDPQLQMAEDAAAQLVGGTSAASLAGGSVDMASSLAPFIIVYDRQGQVLASSGQLHGQTPALPAGVLSGTAAGSERKVTWQPQVGVRVAAVVVATNQGYVLSGRSLREVENRISGVEMLVVAAWALSIGLLVLTFVASRFMRPSPGPRLSFSPAD